MGDDVMAEKVNIETAPGFPADRTAKRFDIKGFRQIKVVDGNGEMKQRFHDTHPLRI